MHTHEEPTYTEASSADRATNRPQAHACTLKAHCSNRVLAKQPAQACHPRLANNLRGRVSVITAREAGFRYRRYVAWKPPTPRLNM